MLRRSAALCAAACGAAEAAQCPSKFAVHLNSTCPKKNGVPATLKSADAKDWAECCAACANFTGCETAVYKPGSYCKLKAACPEGQLKSDQGDAITGVHAEQTPAPTPAPPTPAPPPPTPVLGFQPHIVFFMADDFGWYNVGYHGNSEARTPAIDALVKDGVQLDRHYVYKFCSPTRSSFLSGRLPIRVNTQNKGMEPSGVDLRMATVADKLRSAGYQTHQVGKWHAGASAWGNLPYKRGFMSSFGYLLGATDHYCQGGPNKIDFWDTDGPAYGRNGSKCANGPQTCFSPYYNALQFNNRSLSIIAAHDPKAPLFLYHAWQETHTPNEVPSMFIQDTIDDELRRVYNGMAYCMDTGIANITAALKGKGMWERTFVAFSSDNGGREDNNFGGNNYPLRGMKFSSFEGGVRVNAFAAGGVLPAGRRGAVEAGLMHICDWYATFAELAGVSPADTPPDGLPPPDSMSMWDVVTKGSASPRSVIALSDSALIRWPYKVVRGKQGGKGWWTAPVHPNATHAQCNDTDPGCPSAGCLFHVGDDPAEHVDIAAEHPDVLAQLNALLDAQVHFQTDSTPGYTNCTTEAAFIKAHGNFQGPICYP